MTGTFHRDRFTWLAYLMLAFYGFFLNVLGPITPFLKSELTLSYTIASLHFTAFAVGILLVGIEGHLVIQRLGRRRSLWVGAFGMGLSAAILILGKNPTITIGASFLMGSIGSLILAIVPVSLSEQHGEQSAVAISEANVIASLVATAAPLLVGFFASMAGNWRIALGMVAITPLLLYFIFGKDIPFVPVADSIKKIHTEAAGTLPGKFWLYWVALVLAVSVEFCMIFWSADFLENVLGLVKAQAAQAVSLFFAGMILGRLFGSRLVQRFSPQILITFSILIASFGFLVFWKSGSVLFGLIGLFLTGFGVASLYPLILALAIDTARNNIVKASSRTTLASGTAILTLPLVLGRLADAVGIGLAYGVVVFLLVGVFVIIQYELKSSRAAK